MPNISAVLKYVILIIIALALLQLPIIPIEAVLDDDLPAVSVDGSLSGDEAAEIVRTARGGDFVSALEAFTGIVNQPFTYVSVIGPENIPYDGSIEDLSDVVVGYGWHSGPMSGGGYAVFLKRTEGRWEVIQRSSYLE